MYIALRTVAKVMRVFNSAAAPWQIALGALLGTLIGFLPVFPPARGPAPLGLLLVLLAVIVNCHLASVLLFFGLGWLASKALTGVAIALGNNLDGLARSSAENAFLHHSLWSDTGWLGRTVIGLACAPLAALAMWWFTVQFRTRLRDKLLARRRLVVAGKVGGNGIVLRLVCWFFGL